MVTFLGPENGHGFGPLNPENGSREGIKKQT